VRRPSASNGQRHLRWPDLDVDLALESIEHPERYPLGSMLPRAFRTRSRRAIVRRSPARDCRGRQRDREPRGGRKLKESCGLRPWDSLIEGVYLPSHYYRLGGRAVPHQLGWEG
jgi:hypothetical protein